MATDRIYDPLPKGSQPNYRTAGYKRTDTLAPNGQMSPLRTETELTGPRFEAPPPVEQNLAAGVDGLAIGQLIRIVVRVLDEDDRPQPGALIELWQANAAGKYQHPVDQRKAPIDGNFRSWGRGLADDKGDVVFLTIRPGAYPVPNTDGWWRPPHIHISAYGSSFVSRLVTQVYFPGDPLNDLDAILQGVPDAKARDRLMLKPDPSVGLHEEALGYRFDLVLRGRAATPLEH